MASDEKNLDALSAPYTKGIECSPTPSCEEKPIRHLPTLFCLGLSGLMACQSKDDGPTRPRIEGVELTWLSTTNWLVRYDTTVILLDAFFTRPQLGVDGSKPEGIARMKKMLEAVGSPEVDAILVGHSHYDHVIDAGTASLATGAQLYGSQTTCLIAQSQNLPPERCTVLKDGDQLSFGAVPIDVVRTIHWWPTTQGIGKFQELTEVPKANIASAGPNGGVLSFLFHFEQGGEPVTVFYQNTLGEMDADDGSGEDYVANLERTFANVDQTTVWLGCPDCTNDRAALDAYVNIIRPKWTIPHHWDGPMSDVESGVATPFAPMEIYSQSLEAAGSNMTVPTQYFEPYLLQNGTLSKAAQAPIRDAFNLSAQ